MTQIGYMDRYLQLQKATLTTSAAGSAVHTWALVEKIWAQKIDASRNDADEDYEADQQVAINRVDFVIYHRTDVKAATYRLVDGEDIYDIQGITEEPQQSGQFSRSRFQRLRCLLKDNQ